MTNKNLLVVKSNHIVSASYRLSVAEQRVILCCIAQIRRDQPPSDETFYTVKAADLEAVAGTDIKTAYRDLEHAAERLFDRRITITKDPQGKPVAADRHVTRWVQDVIYYSGQGKIELRFSKTILPFLSGLSEQFTKYELSAVAKMTSAHAIRLYELLAQHGSVGSREISLVDLKDWLQLEGRYSSIKDLKVRVIEPAVKQINEMSPMSITWGQRKTGRVVTHLTFTFKTKTKTSATAKRPIKGSAKKAVTMSELSQLARPGESREQALKRLNVVLSD